MTRPRHDFYEAYVQLSETVRVYYTNHIHGNGFEAKAVEILGFTHPLKDDPWKNSENEFKTIVSAVAHYDGVRHIEWFPDEEGYDNYPELVVIQGVIDVLLELEKSFCQVPGHCITKIEEKWGKNES